MAPERLKGRGATAQSDLWSLGLSFATAVLGDDFLKHADSQFAQLDVASSVKRTLARVTTISEDFKKFLHLCLSKHPAHRPALRELMGHPFLDRRHGWQAKCPEVAVAVRDRKRLHGLNSGDADAMSTEEVLDRLCRVRAEMNLVDSSFDPGTAADLAAELGVTAPFLVRNVHRRTLEFIRQHGGSGSGSGSGAGGGISDSGGENEGEAGGDGGTRETASAGIASASARRRRRRSHDGRTAGNHDRDSGGGEERRRSGERRDGGRSPPPPPPPPPPLPPVPPEGCTASAMEVVPTATADDVSSECSSRSNAFPLVTPRNRPTTAGGSTGTAGFGGPSGGGRSVTASSRRSRRRAMEMTSAVKLTPHKRRGEKKASQTKRNGSRCAAGGPRRSGRRRERERHATAGAGAGAGAVACDDAEPGDPSPEAPKEDPRPAEGMAPAERVAPAEGDAPAEGEAPVDGAGTETAEGAPAPEAAASAPRRHSKERSSRSPTAATASSSTASVGGGGGASDYAQGEPGFTTDVAARRRSWQRKSKKDNKSRASSSRTLTGGTDRRARTMRDVFELADEMKAQIAVRDRVHRLRVYPDCFSGREAVQWMLDGSHASTVKEAENLGNEMMKASVFQHILNSHVFEDSSVFYQFTDGETPPPPSRGGRRVRQIVRAFGGSVARRLVHSSGGGGNGGGGGGGGGGGTSSAVGGSGGGPASGHGAGVEAAQGTPADRVQGGERRRGDVAHPAAVNRTSFSRGGTAQLQQQQDLSRPGDRNSKIKRRSRGRGSVPLHRFSSSVSTLTVPETPY